MLRRLPSPLSPHPFVEVGLHVLSLYTSSHFLTQFQIVPTRLYFLRVNSSPRVHKIATMHHNLVCVNVVYLAIDVSVSFPVVSVDFRPRSDASFYNGVKGGHIPSIDYLKSSPSLDAILWLQFQIPTCLWPLLFLCCTENCITCFLF